MQFTANQIAAIIQGSIEGNGETMVNNFSKIEDSKNNDLCFLANPKYEHYLYNTQASIVIINEDLVLKAPVTCTLIKVKDAYIAFATLLNHYEQYLQQDRARVGIEAGAFIHESANVGSNVYIGANAYISKNATIKENAKIYPNTYIGENALVGANSCIMPNVVVYHNCIINNNCLIHAGCVIGSDGFGFAKSTGVYNKIAQIGNVVIEDNVEIGANTTIDRATMGSTIIKKGVKLDNLVQIAHNVEVGSNTVIAAQAGVSGSTKIGENVVIGGQAGIVGHIQIAKGTQINAQSGVSKAIRQENSALTGSPAGDYKSTLKSQVVFKNLPKLQEQINILEKELAAIKALLKK